jgi:hypothetical protein
MKIKIKTKTYTDFFNCLNKYKTLHHTVINKSNKWFINFKDIKCTVIINYNDNTINIFKYNFFGKTILLNSSHNNDIFNNIEKYINEYITYNNNLIKNNILKLTSYSISRERKTKINNLIKNI